MGRQPMPKHPLAKLPGLGCRTCLGITTEAVTLLPFRGVAPPGGAVQPFGLQGLSWWLAGLWAQQLNPRK